MPRQEINIGTAPTGAGGDTTRSGAVKINAMTAELYARDAQLGTASNANVGTAPGNVMEVGAFGLGKKNNPIASTMNTWTTDFSVILGGTTLYSPVDNGVLMNIGHPSSTYGGQLWMSVFPGTVGTIGFRSGNYADAAFNTIYHTGNTTRGSGGALSAASPIMRIACVTASERRDLQEETFGPAGEWGVVNSEARGVSVERMGVGEYKIAGSLGLALEGWRTQDPCSPDGGRTLGVTESEQSEDGTVIIRLFKQRWTLSDDGEMLPGRGAPMDVPPNSWIDVRLEMPKIETPPPPTFTEE
ncbi:hypothetical protein [Pseudomonas synxantha]|uniref:phage tail fiber protein n=1 Tax=Pseudomonas synxantha TaxID=47883 RepID=UPI00345DB08C